MPNTDDGSLVARSIKITERGSKAAVRIGVRDGTSFITLTDSSGTDRLLLACENESEGGDAGLYVSGLDDEVRMSLATLGGDGSPWIKLSRESSSVGLSLAPGQVVLCDDTGLDRTTLVTAANGGSYLRFWDGRHQNRLALALSARGEPELVLADTESRPRVVLETEADGEGSIVIRGQRGELWRAGRD